jgi:hypothetical protein
MTKVTCCECGREDEITCYKYVEYEFGRTKDDDLWEKLRSDPDMWMCPDCWDDAIEKEPEDKAS